MRRRAARWVAAWAVVVGLGSGERASAERYVVRLDPERSTLAFTLDAVMHTVKGTARFARGEVAWDVASGLGAGELALDARSFASGNGSRDAKMHKEVLESSQFAEVVFALQRLEGTFPTAGKGTLTAVGEVRIAGLLKSARWPVEVEVTGETVRARSSFAVPFIAWGLKDPSVLFMRVGREVAVTIDAVGTLSPAP